MEKEIGIKIKVNVDNKDLNCCGNCKYLIENVIGIDDYEIFYYCDLFKKALFKIDGKIYRCRKCIEGDGNMKRETKKEKNENPNN